MPTLEADDPTLSRPRSPFGLGFRTPADPPPSSLPSPSSSPEESGGLDEQLPDSEHEWDAASLPSSLDEDTPSPGSSRGSADVQVLDSEALQDMARTGVAIVGLQAHEHLARTPGQQAAGLYLTDEQDQAGIGDPLARIAARHQGIGKMNDDTADALAAMVAIARFATKQATVSRQARQYDAAQAAQAAAQQQPPGAGQ